MTLAEIQAKQIRSEGHNPVLCGACGWPGHILDQREDGSVRVRHLGRAFPCRTRSFDLIPDEAFEALEDS